MPKSVDWKFSSVAAKDKFVGLMNDAGYPQAANWVAQEGQEFIFIPEGLIADGAPAGALVVLVGYLDAH